ncbi:MAG: ATP synthase F1 subunit epsilon [Gemmatimonadales bacterium]|nr:ATP synthase F1 subunit epsilon [Gemmatimonadales bacterium]NIN51217.1 ATP synthase F1 subunit epsilon [Gemmatimonadales bacterium]NIP08681.1 ATP synthase F1 subunit epsilon [Gemmatimonadales bacterium]NIR02369.1 ATP synthase F1 subunit epsilon [Gemmatimonadales bacterium]NIS66163.1 ATP synthase F1 subunit epsilon [Gemmatimonadales bacterium]
MNVTVISPERSVYQGDANALVAPAFDGRVGILPRHAPFITLLGDGLLTVREGSETRHIRVRGGFLRVLNDAVDVVAEHAESVEDSDAA